MIASLPGFRELYPPECAARNALIDGWRRVARGYGFVEVEGPTLEPLDLYRKKSGEEIVGQLFQFIDQGGREVALRPEFTPTVARMVATRGREFRKPIRWFGIGRFYRHERPQRGRLREFYQLNCDLIGEASPAADAEMIALSIDLLRGCGLGRDDFAVRVSDRRAWLGFLSEKGVDPERTESFLQVIDRLDRDRPENIETRLAPFGVGLDEVRAFCRRPAGTIPGFDALGADLEARGLGGFVEFDLSVVRGLAYYTGLVFEMFDRRGRFRAIAGGGRYDRLLSVLSDGAVDLPAVGFGLGDVVLGEMITGCEPARAAREMSVARALAIDLYAVVAAEEMRPHALAMVQELRNAGYRVDLPLAPAKVGRQFQNAEQLGATAALLFGTEWPMVRLKVLATRQEETIDAGQVGERLRELFAASIGPIPPKPDTGHPRQSER